MPCIPDMPLAGFLPGAMTSTCTDTPPEDEPVPFSKRNSNHLNCPPDCFTPQKESRSIGGKIPGRLICRGRFARHTGTILFEKNPDETVIDLARFQALSGL